MTGLVSPPERHEPDPPGQPGGAVSAPIETDDAGARAGVSFEKLSRGRHET